jgi:hypothetical protein
MVWHHGKRCSVERSARDARLGLALVHWSARWAALPARPTHASTVHGGASYLLGTPCCLPP